MTDHRPHAKACGTTRHPHGPQCHTNCPTCAGQDQEQADVTTHQARQQDPLRYQGGDMAALDAREQATELGTDPVFQARLVIPWRAWQTQVLSMNAAAARPVQTTGRRRYWRERGLLAYRDLRSVHGDTAPVGVAMAPVRVVVSYGFPSARQGVREGINLAPVTKALVDGLVDAGLAVDDSELYVSGQDSRRLPGRTPVGEVWVVITVTGAVEYQVRGHRGGSAPIPADTPAGSMGAGQDTEGGQHGTRHG